jgi:hypothetical protein
MKKIIFLSFIVIITSCSTLEGLLEDIMNVGSNLSGSSSSSAPATGSVKNETEKKQPARSSTGILSITQTVKKYTLPVSYKTAYSYRTDIPDTKMTRIPQSIEANRVSNPDVYISQIISYINDNSTDEFDRVKKAHDLVAVTIRYDAANFWANTIPNQNFQNVLKTRLAVCEGYSNLFKRLCDELKIPCEVVHGYARGVGSSPLIGDTPNNSNHAWNIVTINEESYLIDCTWDSGFMDGKTAKQQYKTDWLFLKPEHFLYTHYPENERQQLLITPLTAAQFSSLPFFKPKFFELADNLSIDLQKINRVDNKLSFEYEIKEGYSLSFRVNEINHGRQIQNSTFIQNKGTKESVYFSFPAAGHYNVTVFWWKTGTRHGEGCGEFVVEASSANPIQYPTTYSSSAKNLQLISPIEMPLERRKTYTFRIKVDNKNIVAIIYGKTFVQLTKDSEGIFTAEFEIPSNINNLSIGIADSERGRYENVFQYDVK